MSEKLNHIKQLQFFKSLNFEQLNDLAKIANIINIQKTLFCIMKMIFMTKSIFLLVV